MWCFEEGSVVFIARGSVIAMRIPGIFQICVFFPEVRQNIMFLAVRKKIHLHSNQVCGLEPWCFHLLGGNPA